MKLDPVKFTRKLEEKALTAKDLSKITGVAYGSMLNAKNGIGVRTETVKKICEGLGCKPKELLPDIE